MRQTPKGFCAALERVAKNRGIEDLRSQINLWPYPQAVESHIAVWLESWKENPGSSLIPGRAMQINLDRHTYNVAEGEPTPKQLIGTITSRPGALYRQREREL